LEHEIGGNWSNAFFIPSAGLLQVEIYYNAQQRYDFLLYVWMSILVATGAFLAAKVSKGLIHRRRIGPRSGLKDISLSRVEAFTDRFESCKSKISLQEGKMRSRKGVG
jgi:hypothetical protein